MLLTSGHPRVGTGSVKVNMTLPEYGSGPQLLPNPGLSLRFAAVPEQADVRLNEMRIASTAAGRHRELLNRRRSVRGRPDMSSPCRHRQLQNVPARNSSLGGSPNFDVVVANHLSPVKPPGQRLGTE